MFGDTLTVTLDGSGGTARVCSKINQDAYSSEYLNRISTDEIRVKIRHSKEALKAGEIYPMERHNVEFTQTVFATSTVPEFVRQIYVIIRNKPNDTLVDVTNLCEALPFWLTDTNLDKLNIWEV
jgi:hypothetical protein